MIEKRGPVRVMHVFRDLIDEKDAPKRALRIWRKRPWLVLQEVSRYGFSLGMDELAQCATEFSANCRAAYLRSKA